MLVRHSGSLVSVAGDSRITPFGAKLRHYQIDELPELRDVRIGKHHGKPLVNHVIEYISRTMAGH